MKPQAQRCSVDFADDAASLGVSARSRRRGEPAHQVERQHRAERRRRKHVSRSGGRQRQQVSRFILPDHHRSERKIGVKNRCETCSCICRDVAMAIVNSPRWKEALMNEMPDLHNSGRRITPMRKLIMKMPGTSVSFT